MFLFFRWGNPSIKHQGFSHRRTRRTGLSRLFQFQVHPRNPGQGDHRSQVGGVGRQDRHLRHGLQHRRNHPLSGNEDRWSQVRRHRVRLMKLLKIRRKKNNLSSIVAAEISTKTFNYSLSAAHNSLQWVNCQFCRLVPPTPANPIEKD